MIPLFLAVHLFGGGQQYMKAHALPTYGDLQKERVPKPVTIPHADIKDAMRDQLEYLIDHCPNDGPVCSTDCSLCARYERIRKELLELFMEKRDAS